MRSNLRVGFVVFLALGVLTIGVDSASAQLVTCTTTASVPVVDADSSSEFVGEILLTCQAIGTLSVGSFVPNLSISLNTGIGQAQPGDPGPTLIVNENNCAPAAPAGGTFGSCGAPDPRFQDPQLGVVAANSRIEWNNFVLPVPGFDPDGPGGTPANPSVTTLRIAGVRGAPSILGATPGNPSQVTAFVSITGAAPIPVTNNVLGVAAAISGAETQPPPPINNPGFGLTTCTATSTVPAVKAQSLSEVVGDVILTCTAVGPPSSLPTAQMDLSLALNVDNTNDIGFGAGVDVTDAKLIINGNYCSTPAAMGGVFGSCGAPDSRFQDPHYGKLVEANRLEWQDVSFPMPGALNGDGTTFPSVTTLRLTGVKANVQQLGVPTTASFPSTQVVGFVTLNGNAFVSITNNVLNLAAPIVVAPSNQTSPDPSFGVTSCTATAVPPVARATGIAELTGDIVIVCQNTPPPGGLNSQDPKMRLTVSLNTNITNNIGFNQGASRADAVMIVNENNCISPVVPGSRFGNCAAPDSRFQDPQYGRRISDNLLLWNNITFPIPGGGSPAGSYPLVTTIRVTGIRANAAELGIPDAATFPSTQVTAFLSFSGEAAVGITNSVLNVAVPILGLIYDVDEPVIGLQCLDDSRIVNVNVQEGFATAFKTPGAPTFTPGQQPWESGYFAPGSNNGGGASQGTRILFRFSNMPEGVAVSVPRRIDHYTVTSVDADNSGFIEANELTANDRCVQFQGSLSLPATLAQVEAAKRNCSNDAVSLTYVSGADADGAGGALASGSGNVVIGLSNGSGQAVYEVVDADPFRLEECDIPVFVDWTSDAASDLPAVGMGDITVMLGPVSTVFTMSNPAPEPRHVEHGDPETAIAIQRCTTTLLFPFVSNQSGDDTRMVISNASGFAPNTSARSGSCTLHYHGSISGGGAAPVDQTSNPLAPGEQLDFTLADGNLSQGIAGAPGFEGYLMTVCDFMGGVGKEIISDGVDEFAEIVAEEVIVDPIKGREGINSFRFFPFVSNQNGLDTEIVISNTSRDWFGTAPEAGRCSLNYEGLNAPATQWTPTITAGEQIKVTLSGGNPAAGILGAPNFEGSLLVGCGFGLYSVTTRVFGTTPDSYAIAFEPVVLDVDPNVGGLLLYKHVVVDSKFDTTLLLANASAFATACTVRFNNAPSGLSVPPLNVTLPVRGVEKVVMSSLTSRFLGTATATCVQSFVGGSAHIVAIKGGEVTLSAAYNAERIELPRSDAPEPFIIPLLHREGQEDQRITIINTTVDNFGTPAQNGSCTIQFIGETSSGAPPPADLTLTVDAGRTRVFRLFRELKKIGSPDFTGFGVVTCDFPLARGFDARIERTE